MGKGVKMMVALNNQVNQYFNIVRLQKKSKIDDIALGKNLSISARNSSWRIQHNVDKEYSIGHMPHFYCLE